MELRRKKDVQVPSHKKYKRKGKHKLLLRFIKLFLTLAVLSSTATYAAMSPFFSIDDFKVKGSAHYSDQALVSASGIIEGVNGFKLLFYKPGMFYFFRVGSAESSILETCSYVKQVKVRYLVPSTISINVEERKPVAVLKMTGTSLLVDKEGYLLEINPDLKKYKLPVFKIKKPESFKPGKKVNIPVRTMSAGFEIYQAVNDIDGSNKDKLVSSIDYVDVSDLNKIGLSLESRLVVNLGKPEDLNYKLNTVKTIFSKNIKKNERGKLDFFTDGNPVFTPENGG